MAGRKILIKRIENPTTRQVTFSKRRGGLLKKAHDLAVLCDAEVAVVIFSSKGKLFQFASPSMRTVLERYLKSSGDSTARDTHNNVANDRLDELSETLRSLLHSDLRGDSLEQPSLEDLIHLERQIREGLHHIHSKKEELLLEEIKGIKEKVTMVQRTTNANPSILEKLLDFGPSIVTNTRNLGGQGSFEHHCLHVVPQVDDSVSLCELTCERLLATRQLNKSPPHAED